jgi:hypothetical protein
METDIKLNRPQSLNLYQPEHFDYGEQPQEPATPNAWFGRRYDNQIMMYGSPFLELTESADKFTTRCIPVSINLDFFAGILGGRADLNHHVVYYEPELAWYYKESDGIYRITTSDKLAVLYRALMMKCAEDMLPNVHKLNLFHEWRSDHIAKAIVQRAKSILAAGPDFFSATSTNQRIKGPELYERLIRVLVETMLETREGACLTVTQAYNAFCQLAQQRGLGMLKRSMFKELMRELIRDRYGMALRNDVQDAEMHQQQAWKGLKLLENETLAA